MRRVGKWFAYFYAYYGVIFIASMFVLLGCWLGAHRFGSRYPIADTGQIYSFDASGRGGPRLILYVTWHFHVIATAAAWLFWGFLALTGCFLVWAITYRIQQRRRS
jgi:hypothetical protein